MKSNLPIRILLADDHQVVRIGLKTVFELEPDLRVVAEAENRDETLAQFRRHKPDVTIIDLRMPGGGLQALCELHREFPEARLLVLTTSVQEEDLYRAMEAGAIGYCPKTLASHDLIVAIREVHAGRQFLPSSMSRILKASSVAPRLSPREQEVLILLAKGLTNKEIASTLAITTFTAKAHVASLLHKLDVSDRTEAATAAFQRGYISNE